jgi:hypothetical protein
MQTFIDQSTGRPYKTTGEERVPLDGEKFLRIISGKDGEGKPIPVFIAQEQKMLKHNGNCTPKYKGEYEIVTLLPNIS